MIWSESAYRKKSWNCKPHPIKRKLIPILACSDMLRLCLFFTLISLTVIFSGKPGVLFNEPLSSQMHSVPGNLWEVVCNWWDRPWEHSSAHFWKVIKGSCLSVKALLALALFDSLDNCPSFLMSKRRRTDGRWRMEWCGGVGVWGGGGWDIRLAQPETQLPALIDFLDGKDFLVQGPKPSNLLKGPLAEASNPTVQCHIVTCVLMDWQRHEMSSKVLELLLLFWSGET